jgi:hypothetical protein
MISMMDSAAARRAGSHAASIVTSGDNTNPINTSQRALDSAAKILLITEDQVGTPRPPLATTAVNDIIRSINAETVPNSTPVTAPIVPTQAASK